MRIEVRLCLAAIAAAVFGGEATAAEGEPGLGPEMIGAFAPMRSDLENMRARGFFATGLRPVYPDAAACLTVNSFFADATRGDGSARNRRFYQGHHGGMDIPAPEGTRIVAVADGVLVSKVVGGNIGGIGMVLQHSPEDTGLPVWTYTEYKHLQDLPKFDLGQNVRKGEVIAKAGLSGTTGGHFGPRGHSHLHLSVWYSTGNDYRSQRMFAPVEGYWMDPLALFRRPPFDSAALRDLPEEGKKTPIAYKSADGRIFPEGSKVVWPFVCTPR
ncbi:MAG: M23 family metallopeptidase [Betaproteobacteria bacterium]|nr:M23 family metallopeptidase [Betaproteobacteria bacterium]